MEPIVNPQPELVNKERAKYLLEKWSKILDYNDTQTVSPSASGVRLNTAIILESQERWIDPVRQAEWEARWKSKDKVDSIISKE